MLNLDDLINDLSHKYRQEELEDCIEWLTQRYRAADADIMAPPNYKELVGGLIFRYCVAYERITGQKYSDVRIKLFPQDDDTAAKKYD
jgi:hypothetical protein